jgi:hypothetical protein
MLIILQKITNSVWIEKGHGHGRSVPWRMPRLSGLTDTYLRELDLARLKSYIMQSISKTWKFRWGHSWSRREKPANLGAEGPPLREPQAIIIVGSTRDLVRKWIISISPPEHAFLNTYGTVPNWPFIIPAYFFLILVQVSKPGLDDRSLGLFSHYHALVSNVPPSPRCFNQKILVPFTHILSQ